MEWNRPEDWNDEERCRFLFSPLPTSRVDKPMHWDTKVSFWSELVCSSCRDLQQASVVGSELENRFIRKGMKPSSLDRVVSEMCRLGTLQKLHDWESRCQNPRSWLAWGASLAWKPVSWAAKSVLGDNVADSMKEVYVIPRLIEEYSRRVLSLRQSQTKDCHRTSAMSARAFTLLCQEALPYISERDVQLIKLWLMNAGKLAVRRQSGPHSEVVKLAKQGETKASPVTDVDLGILRLRNTAEVLSQQIAELLANIDKLREKALERKNTGLKDSALAVLRRRHHLVKCLSKKEGMADNIEQLLERIESADSEKSVLVAYQAGVVALRQTLADPRLNPENIDATLDSLREVLEDHAEIRDTLSAGDDALLLGEAIDMSELEAELAALTVQDCSSQPTSQTGNVQTAAKPSLPTAPTELPPTRKGQHNKPVTPQPC